QDYLRYPIAPASITKAESSAPIFIFHQLVARSGAELTFETYDSEYPLPTVGAIYDFCSNFSLEHMDAARDTKAIWRRSVYPDDGSHAHCVLTWETISAYSGQQEGYQSEHGWITVEAYHKFIEQDRYRLRKAWVSIETRPNVPSIYDEWPQQ